MAWDNWRPNELDSALVPQSLFIILDTTLLCYFNLTLKLKKLHNFDEHDHFRNRFGMIILQQEILLCRVEIWNHWIFFFWKFCKNLGNSAKFCNKFTWTTNPIEPNISGFSNHLKFKFGTPIYPWKPLNPRDPPEINS